MGGWTRDALTWAGHAGAGGRYHTFRLRAQSNVNTEKGVNGTEVTRGTAPGDSVQDIQITQQIREEVPVKPASQGQGSHGLQNSHETKWARLWYQGLVGLVEQVEVEPLQHDPRFIAAAARFVRYRGQVFYDHLPRGNEQTSRGLQFIRTVDYGGKERNLTLLLHMERPFFKRKH